ncbi:MAG: 16S rRNA (cytosine(967)-C(5))-methyltransferase RsmB [candidate division Zixibacteria bacterium]|nr:16S rRNA (cytosine(967)-C(5))-methyltransferase RsmB [candidate division Zixibacteria bacterium]
MVQKTKTKTRGFDPVRAAAVESLVLIEQGQQADYAIEGVIRDKNFRPLDIRFLSQLVNGATKMRRRLDHELRFYLAKPSTNLPLLLANVLRLGLYQLRFTDRIPDAAAVSESVNLAMRMMDRPRANLVNAVLRASIREPEKVQFVSVKDDPVKHLADYYSFPDYFVKYCYQEYGLKQTKQLLQNFNKPPRVTYRVNFLKAKPEEIIELLKKEEVKFSEGKFIPEFIHIDQGGLPLERELLQSGKVFVQDESAGIAVRLLNPRPDQDCLDLASAPGGKSTYMAIRMRNKGRITSVDKSKKRLEVVAENTRRLGIKIVSPVACDIMEFKGGPFDRVLLDPPCTGWGTAGKHSDLRWSKTVDDVKNLAKIQTAMIDRAAKLVKPGGVLVYSTCTIMRAENDQIIEEFLLRNDKFEIDPASQFFPDKIATERGFVKTYPNVYDLDGAFCARLKRKL